MSYTPDTFADGTAGNTPITAAKLNNIENELVAIDPLAHGAIASTGSTSTSGFKITDPSDSSTEWNFFRASGSTSFTINGKTSYPADLTLFAPNGTDYADYTFDGSNAEIDVTVGNLSLRPLSGGNVNIWATTGTPKLRVGSTNMAQSMDFTHDGTNGNISTTTGDVNLTPSSGLVNLTNVGAYTTATAGGASALPTKPQGYIAVKVQGTQVKIPYYLP